MGMIKRGDAVVFADSKTEDAFNSLSDDDFLKKAIKKAFGKLKENVFCGERVGKNLIPKEFKKRSLA